MKRLLRSRLFRLVVAAGLVAAAPTMGRADCHLAYLDFIEGTCWGTCTSICFCTICDPIIINGS